MMESDPPIIHSGLSSTDWENHFLFDKDEMENKVSILCTSNHITMTSSNRSDVVELMRVAVYTYLYDAGI
jgi:hypothetical protein